METVIVDAGPLVAYVCQDDQDHPWTKEQFRHFQSPLLTCDAVVSEALFVLGRLQGDVQPLLELLERGIIIPSFNLSSQLKPVCELIRRYRNVPMSLADACLVRMTELQPSARVFTLDRDFTLYRKNRRQAIPLIFPTD